MRIKNSIRFKLDGLSELANGKAASQRQVAFASGLDPSVVSDIATGKREPLVGTALKIAAALGCSVDDIFALNEEAT